MKIAGKDKTSRVVLKKMVVGHFAMWAVRQSPYLLPESLEDGIKEFNECFVFKKKIGNDEFTETTYRDFKEKITDTISNSDKISSWNIAKMGRGPVVVSCYSYPKADYDFIDLDALARNIAQSVWAEILYNDGRGE